MNHHCQLYQNIGWTSLTLRREQHCLLFIYSVLLPVYLTNLLAFRLSNYSIRTHTSLALNVPKVRTEVGKTAFEYFALFKWNKLLSLLQLNAFIPFNHFKHILVDFMHSECTFWNCSFVRRRPLIRVRVTGAAASARKPRPPPPQPLPPALPEGSQGVPRPVGRCK